MAGYKVLGIAVATGKVGYALLEGERLIDWGLSKVASKSPAQVAAKTSYWIDLLKPEALVSEQLTKRMRKHGLTIKLLAAIAKAAEDAPVINVTVPRLRIHKNKYEEAEALARRFPELKSQLPKKPPCWLPEPRSMIFFEALTLALSLKLADDAR
ncbi:MAG: hypothetical protein V7703_15765 [Hyphomicrobiales bacterium]